jgi:hypothetical protein
VKVRAVAGFWPNRWSLQNRNHWPSMAESGIELFSIGGWNARNAVAATFPSNPDFSARFLTVPVKPATGLEFVQMAKRANRVVVRGFATKRLRSVSKENRSLICVP